LSEVTAIAHPNFALIKYWGKTNSIHNIPAMSSISLTVDTLASTTKISQQPQMQENVWELNGERQPDLGQLLPTLDYLSKVGEIREPCLIQSDNNFPTAAGLASSASGVASIVVAYNRLFDLGLTNKQMAKAAMLGSGSAPRSLLPGIVLLDIENQFDCRTLAEPNQWPLSVIVCITDDQRKTMSSREGMEISRKTSPLYESWLKVNASHIKRAKKAINERNLRALGLVAEENCKQMHEVMRTSNPSINYMTNKTIDCINAIESIRNSGFDLFYTVDAGPQVKIICKTEDNGLIQERVSSLPSVRQTLIANIGYGARVINEG
jgi:diphosphomevalonate decarboxylase